MLVLGIESSCDETAAAVVEDGRRVLSNVIASQHELHAEYAGVVPEIASRAHVERVLPVVREALAEAGAGLGRIDAVAVGNRPGLIGSLLVGVAAAKALAWSLGRPLIGVDHVRAHLYSGVLEAERETASQRDGETGLGEEVCVPALGLVASGGHTALYRVDSWTRIARLGGTIDDAVGEAYDKAAKILGLPQPGGPVLDALAREPGADDRAISFPVSRLSRESLDFSFSGLKTALLYAAEGVPGPRGAAAPPMSPARRADLAASFQRAAVGALLLKLHRALERLRLETGAPRPTLLTGGGVTRNSLLRQELLKLAEREGVDVRLPAPAYCTDNAAMIAGLGCELLRAGERSGLDLQAEPTPSL